MVKITEKSPKIAKNGQKGSKIEILKIHQ